MAPFIVGVPRSGTTLLRLMLDAHPLVAIPPETGFLSSVLRWRWVTSGRLARAHLGRIITHAASWPDFHLDPAALYLALDHIVPFRLADGVRAFYKLYASRFGKPLWGDKTPTYGRRAAAIARLLPEAHFIHIIRDGRDVAVSLAPMWFAPSRHPDVLAAYWIGEIKRTRHQATRIQHYLEVRYEDLVRDPRRVLQTICGFLGLELNEAMLRYYETAGVRLDEQEGRTDRRGHVSLTKGDRRLQQWRTEQPLDLARVERWREEMDATALRAFEGVAGSFLRDLGYAPATQ